MLVEVCPHMLDFSGRYEEAFYLVWILDVSPIVQMKRHLELLVLCTICQSPVASPVFDHNWFVMRMGDELRRS